MIKIYCSNSVKTTFILWVILSLISASTSISARSLIIDTKGYVSGQLSRVKLDANQSGVFGKVYIGEILLGHDSATFISLGNQPEGLVANPWRFCFEKDEYDEVEELIGNDVVLEFKTPRKNTLLSCTSANELVEVYPANDGQILEPTHVIGAIRTTDPQISHGVEFGRVVNVIKNNDLFNIYFMTMQVGSGGSQFRHFIIDNTDLFDFAIQSLQAAAMVKVHYSDRFSRKNLFGLSSMSYVSEIEMVDQGNID